MADTQIPLPLTYKPANHREDFFVAPCNQDAVRWLEQVDQWPSNMTLLLGAPASGKSHLASVFSEDIFSAKDLTVDKVPFYPMRFALEDIDYPYLDEQALFHLYNYATQKGQKILLTARAVPFFKLPDLKTRISTVPVVRIGLPDDTLLMSLIYKGLAERQLDIQPDVLEYISKHIERSFAAVDTFVQKAQMMSLAERRKVTIPLSRAVLEQMQSERLL